MPETDLVSTRSAALLELFANRRDLLAVLAPWGKPSPIEVDDEKLAELVLSHLTGEKVSLVFKGDGKKIKTKSSYQAWRIGFYTPTPGASETRWTCVDVDGGGSHKTGVKNPELAALRIARRAELMGLEVYLERSGGGVGLHAWVFYTVPIPAKLAREVGLALCPPDIDLEKPTRSGLTTADPTRNRGLEVFPKTTVLKEGGTGGMVWAPWWFKAAASGNRFFEKAAAGLGAELEGASFRTHSPDEVDAALKIAAKWKQPDRDLRRRSSSPDWESWKLRACDRLPLERVYGEYLTGKTSGASKGWLECRDPWSPSGDQDPSAGVADTEAGVLRGTWHSFISGETKSVFAFLMETGKAKTAAEADRIVAELSGERLPIGGSIPRAKGDPPPGEEKKKRPQLTATDVFFSDLERDSWEALLAWNKPPQLFRRGDAVVELVVLQSGKLGFRALTHNAMRSYLDVAAEWYKQTKDGPRAAWPPETIAKLMLDRGYERLPPIESIARAPFYDENLNLVSTDGYHPIPQVWFDAGSNIELTGVKDEPGIDWAEKAVSFILEELFTDFAFVSVSDQAHVFAALLQPLVRLAIKGPCPLYLIEAPKAGTGKTAICEVVSLVTSGQRLSPRVLPHDDDELHKKLLGELLEGHPIICFDNVTTTKTLTALPLMNALTSDSITGRPLGATKTLEVRNRALWMLTGNNVRLSAEFVRRCVRTRLDTGLERPHTRTAADFRHGDLFQWIADNRGRIVRALLTIVNYWRSQGAPRIAASKASFYPWASTIGGILESVGVPGFLENETAFFEDTDTESDDWAALVAHWLRERKTSAISAAEVYKIADRHDLVPEARTGGNDRINAVRFGRALGTRRDQVIGGYRIVRGGLSAGIRLWHLERVEENGEV